MNSFRDAARHAIAIELCLLATVLAMAPLAAWTQGGEADAREVRNYKLTMDKIKKADQALQSLAKDAAVRAAIRKAAADEQAKAETAVEEEEQSLSSTAKKMEALHPAVKSAFQTAGISTREYLVLSFAWASAAFASEMKKSGAITELPPEVSKENVAFVEANAKELQAIAERWKKLNADMGLGAQDEQ